MKGIQQISWSSFKEKVILPGGSQGKETSTMLIGDKYSRGVLDFPTLWALANNNDGSVCTFLFFAIQS